MSKYADSLFVKEALQSYFSEYHFKDGGYHLRWFKIKLGPLFIPLPNIKSRIKAVKIHDIHHLITEYNADWKGEAEIGAWEIAAGCGKYTVAWILNLGSFFVGMFLYPKALFRAFMRGRKCTGSLYHSAYEASVECTLGELRKKIKLDSDRMNDLSDYFLFGTWWVISFCWHGMFLLIFCFFIEHMMHY